MYRLFIFLLTILMSSACMSQERLSLCGKWDFYCSEGQHRWKWRTITVPSCWEQQGYGSYTYGRFYKTKGLKASDETGLYRRYFSIPKSWSGKVVRLVFEGSMTDTEVWIDGKRIGPVHQGGFTEFSYDVSSFIQPGRKQQIEIHVRKESLNASVNSAERRADWWLFGGIYRPLYFEALPQEHIRNVAIDARADGRIYARVTCTGTAGEAQPSALSLSIGGRSIPVTVDGTSRDGNDITYSIHSEYPQPRTWDPEHPNLYDATFSLGSGKHSVSQRIGFRTIEFREHDGIYLNGTKLIVKGTNRHCFWPETGRTVTREQSLMDARIIKQMNMNAVRSHYPPDRHFLEICDSMGLLYLNELPGWQTHYDDTMAVKIVNEFIPRDVNHPCIFLWSNGNEGGWNTSIDHLFAQLDIQQRKVVHPWSDFDGIDTHHYPAYQTGTYRLQNGQNVFMPTEFLHSKYDKGGGAALEDMWGHWLASPLFAGGFIWAYCDEAVRRTDMGGILDSDGGNGPDGVVSAYRQPEASVSTIREVWSPIYIDRISRADIAKDRLLVSNRYLFTNLSECSLRYKLRGSNMAVCAEGTASLPSLEPGESGYARLNLPAGFKWQDYEAISITAYDAKGEEVCSWTEPLRTAAMQQTDDRLTAGSTPETDALSFSDDGTVRLGNLEGPLPVGMLAECYRHTERTETDGTRIYTYYYKGGIDSICWRVAPDSSSVTMDAVILNDERGHGFKGQWLTDESKWQLGFSFRYPESNIDSVQWMGRGPYRVWRNRLRGQQFGIWSKAYNNTITGQYNSVEPPAYPEFKGYYADLRWARFVTKDSHDWVVTSESEGIFLRLFTPEEAIDQTPGEMGGMQEGKTPKQERTMVKFPDGDISFLLSIPPMQSYKPLEQLGPHSQPDNIRIKSGDRGFHIRLRFMPAANSR